MAVNGFCRLLTICSLARPIALMNTHGSAAPAARPRRMRSRASRCPHGVGSQATITLLQTHSLTTVVQGEIERMILAGELAPGAKLTEAALADRLGVSRGPMREAFRMLEEAGLVRTEKNRGVFVRDIPIDEAIEIFDLRATMDELGRPRLAERITPDAAEGSAQPGRADGARGEGRPQHQCQRRLPPAEPAVPRPPGRDGRQPQADRRSTASWSRNCRCSAALNLADGQQMPVSAQRAPRHPQGHRRRRRRRRRPRAVRPCDGKQGAHDRRTTRRRRRRRAAPAAAPRKARHA